MKNYYLLAVLVVLINCQSGKKTKTNYQVKPLFHIPEITDFKLDGKLDEWSKNGLKVKLYCDAKGTILDTNSIAANFKLAWNKEGLCIFVEVADNEVAEQDLEQKKYQSDGLEVFLGDKFAGKNMLQYVISIRNGKCVTQLWEARGSREVTGIKADDIQVANWKTAKGMNYELMIPFRYIGIKPETGKDIAFQLYVNDVDNNGSQQRLEWYYQATSYLSPQYLQSLLLDKNASADVDYSVHADIIDEDSAVVQVVANKSWNGKKLELFDTAGIISTLFTVKNNVAVARFSIPVQKLIPVEKTKFLTVDTLVLANIDFDVIDYVYKTKPIKNLIQEILWYQRIDRQTPPPAKPIVFVGHSMFRYWKTFEDDLAGLPAINRAIGGAQIEDLIQNYNILIKQYNPSKVVINIGYNDVNTGETADTAFAEFQHLYKMIRTDFPDIYIYVCSAHEHQFFINNLKQYNDKVMDFVSKQKNASLIDFRKTLMDKNNNVYEGVFIPDYTHYSPLGYSYIAPVVKKALQ